MKYAKIFITVFIFFICSIFFSVKIISGKKGYVEYDYYIDGTISSEKPIRETHIFDDYYCVNGLTGYFNNNDYLFIPNKTKNDRCLLFFKTIISDSPLDNTTKQEEKTDTISHMKVDEYKGYLKENAKLYSVNKKNKVVTLNINQFQVVTVIGKTDDRLVIKYNKKNKTYTGLIKPSTLKKLPSTYIEVDISDQYLKIIKNNKRVLMTNIVSGKPSTPTPLGYYEVNGKVTKVYLKGPTWNSYVDYFVPFIRKEYGFHDASWQTSFGGKRYLTNGSHGCVNIAPNMMPKVYEQMEIGMKVIIHE